MSKLQRFFSQPFRKTFRHRRPPQLDQMRRAKRRKAIQALRQQKSAGIKEARLLNTFPDELL